MISLNYSKDDPYSRYGIEHFIGKSGLGIQINKPGPAGIMIAYGSDTPGEFVISVKENPILDKVTGSVSATDGSYLICETAHETGNGNGVIAVFDNGTRKYPCMTRKDRGIEIGIDIFKETGHILSGHPDRIRSVLSEEEKRRLASQPTVDFLENLLLTAILAGSQQLHVPLVQ